MTYWAGLPRPRWMTDFRSDCDVENDLKQKLNLPAGANVIAYKDALQKHAQQVYQDSILWEPPTGSLWCPQCKEGGQGLLDSLRPAQDRGGNQTLKSVYPLKR